MESALYLAKASRFPDPLEGTIPVPSQEHLRHFENQFMGGYDADRAAEIERDHRNSTFVTCWHINTLESIYMWKDYCGLSGVVITTYFDKLDDACENAAKESFFLGCVNYIMDWTTYYVRLDNAFFRFTTKDAIYHKECEARILHLGSPNEEFVMMPIILPEVIHRIYVHPLATEDYYNGVKALLEKHAPELLSKLEWSSLRGHVTIEDFE